MNLSIARSLLLVALVAIGGVTFAEQARHIHVNGECLDEESFILVDQLFGTKVPDGFYWINFNTGEWGLEGQQSTLGVLQTIVEAQQSSEAENDGTYSRPEINYSQNGSVVSGQVNGQNCTYASAGGTTVKLCD